MMQVGRRAVIKAVATGFAAAISPVSLLGLAPADAELRVLPMEDGAAVPSDFTGLSYESSQLAHPAFFSAQNRALVQFFRTLGPSGVLRIGGNMSEYAVWSPDGSLSGLAASGTEGPDTGQGVKRTFPIVPQAIDNLAEFLQATGWRLLYGLNMAGGSPVQAAEEAAYVAGKVGGRLVAFQFGNEPDLFKHRSEDNRPWTFEEYISRWREFLVAVRRRVPGVAVVGPDTSHKIEWVRRFAAEAKQDVAFLTTHYYAEGPPTDPRMTIDYLLHPGETLKAKVLDPMDAARRAGLPYRMSEGNSCYNGGKRGVSETFASALWVADFMLGLARSGATGVNLHGGGDGLYTPIAGSSSAGYQARPIYYGMLLAEPFLGARMLKTELEADGANLAAYAATRSERTVVAVINRESRPVRLRVRMLDGTAPAARGSILRLTAPGIDSVANVTLGGSQVSADGVWKPTSRETLSLRTGSGLLELPAYSVALVSMDAGDPH